MRTKRRFAHELYPHPGEWEVQPLHKAVPYLYAQAVGLEVQGTDWFTLWRPEHKETEPDRAGLTIRLTTARTMELLAARQAAFMADAMLQGLTGPEAWEWAATRCHEEAGELIYERAVHYKVPVELIKPYVIVEEPDNHDHLGPENAQGFQKVTRVEGKESECVECCDPDPVVAEDLFGEATPEPQVAP